MASNAIRCARTHAHTHMHTCTHTLHTHTIPNNRADSDFCRNMLGQDVGRFFICDLNFYRAEIVQKSRIILTIRFNILCCDKWGQFNRVEKSHSVNWHWRWNYLIGEKILKTTTPSKIWKTKKLTSREKNMHKNGNIWWSKTDHCAFWLGHSVVHHM